MNRYGVRRLFGNGHADFLVLDVIAPVGRFSRDDLRGQGYDKEGEHAEPHKYAQFHSKRLGAAIIRSLARSSTYGSGLLSGRSSVVEDRRYDFYRTIVDGFPKG